MEVYSQETSPLLLVLVGKGVQSSGVFFFLPLGSSAETCAEIQRTSDQASPSLSPHSPSLDVLRPPVMEQTQECAGHH